MPKANPQHSHIPLVCRICPDDPQFSDISHLLTHVSSKAHLGHKFNLELSSETSQQASYQLQAYNSWYQTYGIAGLLSDRISAKENKKNGYTRQKSTRTQPKKGKAVVVKSENIHPDLYDHPVDHVYRAPMPQMQSFMAAPMNSNPYIGGYGTNYNTPAPRSDWDDDDSPYDTPSMNHSVPNFAHVQEKEDLDVAEDATSQSLQDGNAEEDEEEEDTHQVSRASQLKGVIWPGMSIFDSATEDNKKRRNQKKDGSILEAMKDSSHNTVPEEVVLYADFSFKRSRPLYGQSDSEAEDEGLELPPVPTSVKRRTRKANALTKVDGNAPRLRKSSAMNVPKRSGLRTRSNMHVEDESKASDVDDGFLFVATAPVSRSTPYRMASSTSVSRYEPSIDEEDNFSSFREVKPAKKAKIQVHRDDEPENLEVVSPGSTESTLEDHRFEDFHPDFYNAAVQNRQASPSPSYRQSLGSGRYSFNGGGMGRFREEENMVADHRFVAESTRQITHYGHASSFNFAPAYSRQHGHESAMMNPLRAIHQQSQHPPQFGHNFYDYSNSNGYAGNFRPVNMGQHLAPLPSYLSGGPSSRNDEAVLLNLNQDENNIC